MQKIQYQAKKFQKRKKKEKKMQKIEKKDEAKSEEKKEEVKIEVKKQEALAKYKNKTAEEAPKVEIIKEKKENTKEGGQP